MGRTEVTELAYLIQSAPEHADVCVHGLQNCRPFCATVLANYSQPNLVWAVVTDIKTLDFGVATVRTFENG